MKILRNDEKILKILCQNGKLSARQISMRTGLNTQTVINRLRRMEKENIIMGYAPLINWKALEYSIYEVWISGVPKSAVGEDYDNYTHIMKKYPECVMFVLLTGEFQIRYSVKGKNEAAILVSIRKITNDLKRFVDVKKIDIKQIMFQTAPSNSIN